MPVHLVHTHHTDITSQPKNTKGSQVILAAFYRHAVTMKVFTFRGSRQKQSTSCDRVHDGQPIRDDRSSLPFSRGSRACSLFFCCEAEMFFSSFYVFIFVIDSLIM